MASPRRRRAAPAKDDGGFALRRYVEKATTPMAMFDMGMRYLAASATYRRQYGLGKATLVGRSHYDVFPEVPKRWRAVHRATLAGAHRHKKEDLFVRADGSVQWIEWDMRPWFSGADRIGGAILATSNAGPRRRLRRLQESRDRLYQLLFEQSPVGIAILDAEGLAQRCNPAMLAQLDRSADAVIGQPLFAHVHPDDRQRANEAIERLGRGEAGETLVDCRITDTAGRQRWLYTSLSALSSDEDPSPRIAVLSGDRTERHLANLEIRRREQLLQSLMQTAADAIVIIDGRGIILSANPATERMFGHGEAELVGQSVSTLMPAEERGHHGSYMARFQETRESRIIGRPRAVTGCRKDGSRFPLQLSVAEIDHQNIYVGFMHDLTQGNALRAEIVSVATLEQQRIGQELHDATQQELTGLSLLAQSLVDRLESRGGDEAGLELARHLASGVKRTQLSVQEIARGLLPVPIDASSLPAALARLAESVAGSGTLACESRCMLPPESLGAEAATHLYRIAQEAVGNAVRHAGASRVTIELAMDGHDVTLKVEDNGRGLDRRAANGRGVGLRLMEHRCSLAGGELAIGNATGGGTYVACRIPVAWSPPR